MATIYTEEQKAAHKVKLHTESVSRKYRRAEKALEAAIHDLGKAGYDTSELFANLELVQVERQKAREYRQEARDEYAALFTEEV